MLGEGDYGRLGNGGTSDKTTPTLTSSLGTGRTAVALSSGEYHTCAILDNGAVSCWGDGAYGRLGNGATSDKLTPTLTSSLGTGRTAVALSSGYSHTCAILDNGAVSCWGDGVYGQLGNGGSGLANYKTTPTLTSSLGTGRTAVALSSGYSHTCAILDNGAVSCWEMEPTADWVMEERLKKPHLRSPAASVQVEPLHFLSVISMTMVRSIFSNRIPTLTIENLRSLREVTTPAPSLTTVLCRAGEMEPTADWVMVQRLTNQHPRSPAASVQVAQQYRSLPVIPTPAPSLTTVLCRAGEGDRRPIG